jgi:hypothetical protein
MKKQFLILLLAATLFGCSGTWYRRGEVHNRCPETTAHRIAYQTGGEDAASQFMLLCMDALGYDMFLGHTTISLG